METSVSNGRLVYYDLQAESFGWLFKSPVAVMGHIVSAPLQVARQLVLFFVGRYMT